MLNILNVLQYKSLKTLASLRHADQTHNAEKLIRMPYAHVYQASLDHLLIVDPNVLSVPNVAKTKHVSTKNASIHVPALAVQMQDVKFSTITLSVVAQQVTLGILSSNAFLREVSLRKKNHEFPKYQLIIF